MGNKLLELIKREADQIDRAFNEAVLDQDNAETKGNKREDAFKTSLKKFLSMNYDLGKGSIHTQEGFCSKNIDCIIFDHDHPRLQDEKKSIFFIEGCHAAIEIKGTLQKNELISGLKQVHSNQPILLVLKGFLIELTRLAYLLVSFLQKKILLLKQL